MSRETDLLAGFWGAWRQRRNKHRVLRVSRKFPYRAIFRLSAMIAVAFACHTQADQGVARYFPAVENEVIREINKVRTNPKGYANYLKQERAYYHGMLIRRPGRLPVRTREGRHALEACIAALEQATPVAALLPDECLSRSARLLAIEQAGSGAMGHVCADGRTLKDRILQFCGDRYSQMAENISYNGRDARSIVIRFLIDDGIPSRGHRINLMNPSCTHCGAAMASHPVHRNVCVIDFAAY
jgi:hypothetical protein